ncbi:TPA: hypothetical protein MY503_004863 [Escherichia coli]|uniref:DUF6572 domain-containing protein n=1 Tax=Proteus mirabilis TaxID=584 RepID=UPI000DEB9173|nr:DUF6572 domain-containing protein [Proteus mirabilis]EFJ3386075.1 hypothetical protein [Escherichia coli]EFP5560410.1 hypothetical protein [Escherichia coli]EHS6058876.1 hypothetical protein [Escherichia coli]EKI3807606.1 hypothetical protein [Escherichia coli]EKJ2682477.1 hypothetical protein [Escherichia coli]
MSIVDTNNVDMIGIPKENAGLVRLGITDHLSWNDDKFEHLYLLQEKINSYIHFIESKEIYEVFPESKGINNFLIEMFFLYEIPTECIEFLDKIKDELININTSLRYEVDSE